MIIMDDWKKMAEDGLKAIKETAQDIAFSVEKQAKVGKKRYLDIAKIQRSIDKLLIDIGEYTFDEVTAGRDVSRDDPFLKERTSSILRMRQEIDEIEEEISRLKRSKSPEVEP